MGDSDSETFTNITKAEFDFDDEAFDAVSQDAKDFISALLIKRKEYGCLSLYIIIYSKVKPPLTDTSK